MPAQGEEFDVKYYLNKRFRLRIDDTGPSSNL